jgi:hypothetical protein
MTPTKKQLLDHYDRVGEPAELTEYAAANAAQELATNWETALRDGASLETLLHDVDRVVLILQAWKATLADKLGS